MTNIGRRAHGDLSDCEGRKVLLDDLELIDRPAERDAKSRALDRPPEHRPDGASNLRAARNRHDGRQIRRIGRAQYT